MTQNQALRATILQEVEGMGQRRRFGLFSSPISTAIGDDGQYKTKMHPRNEQGKPQTEPRGFYTNPPHKGQLGRAYFSGINSLAAGAIADEYIDPDRKLLQIANKNFKNGYKKQQQFRPASGRKELHQSSYEYKQQNSPEKEPKRNREQDGRVKVHPRNFGSNQQSTVIRAYFKPIKYMEDPYQRAHQMSVDKMKKDKSLEGQAAFKLNLHPKQILNKDKIVFGLDVQIPEKKHKQLKLNIFKHQGKWKSTTPNKKGLYGYFMPFPPYQENPPKEKTRKPKDETGRQSFRRMSVALSKPSPTIAYNPLTLRRTISHSFSHRR